MQRPLCSSSSSSRSSSRGACCRDSHHHLFKQQAPSLCPARAPALHPRQQQQCRASLAFALQQQQHQLEAHVQQPDLPWCHQQQQMQVQQQQQHQHHVASTDTTRRRQRRASVVARATGNGATSGGGAAGPQTAVEAPPPMAAAAAAASSASSSGSPDQQQQQAVAGSTKADADEWGAEIEETLKLVRLLPPTVRVVLESHPRLCDLLEVVMDLGRPPTARFPGADERLAEQPVTDADLDYAVTQVGEFGGDNRAGIDATLHRISCLRNRSGRIVGLTCRVGRAIHGSAELVSDLITSGASLLFMGRPGVGKTTAIRELSRTLADDLARRVVIVDTSNEIGGDGDVPHGGIGRARRMQVPDPEAQHRLMIEAVENHMPQVVVIDEIGTEAEAAAARTIAQRGVQLVATAHGNELQNLVKNPALCDLVGGIQSVTLGDEEAKRRGVQKSILERAAPPTFDVAVEMLERGRWCVYTDVAAAVDALLAGQHPGGQMRERGADGTVSRYTFSARSPTPSRNGGSSGSSGGASSSGRVLPDVGRSASLSLADGGDLYPPAPGSAVGRLLRGRRGSAGASSLSADAAELLASGRRGGRPPALGLPSPAGAALRLHAPDLDEERLWEVMAAMGLHDKVFFAQRPGDADAVLAVRSRLRSNAGLRAAAREAGVPVYAIKSSSSSNLVRAFRTLLGLEPAAGGAGLLGSRSMDEAAAAVAAAGDVTPASAASSSTSSGEDTDEGDDAADSSSADDSSLRPHQPGGVVRALQQEEEGLEEARLAVEQIVLPLQQAVELLPRPELVRKAQAALCERHGLAVEVVGSGAEARLRISPPSSS